MLVAVHKVGKLIQGKYDNPSNQRIVMKCIDKEDQYGKTYYGLNISPDRFDIYSKWMPHMIEGTVLNVNIAQFQGRFHVDKFCQFSVVKKV